jgi:hypothetical protein
VAVGGATINVRTLDLSDLADARDPERSTDAAETGIANIRERAPRRTRGSAHRRPSRPPRRGRRVPPWPGDVIRMRIARDRQPAAVVDMSSGGRLDSCHVHSNRRDHSARLLPLKRRRPAGLTLGTDDGMANCSLVSNVV